jgi:acyl-CoA thioester hydrolase
LILATDPADSGQGASAFSFPVRVYYEDTDFSGVVYHASYLRFLERGRTEYLRALGVHQQAIADGARGEPFAFAVRRMTIDFLRAARMDDLLEIETMVTRLGGASIEMQQCIRRDGEALLKADVTVAVVVNGRAGRMPQWVRALFDGASNG